VTSTWIILAAPLAGALLLLLVRPLERVAGALASLAVAVAFAASALAWLDLTAQPAGARSGVRHLFVWAVSGALKIGVDLRWDPLAVNMALVVTGVGFLIHAYSIGYMRGDPLYRRFFAYLNLFVFFMLTLVLADNLLLLYVGWEGVGLCSYLLIGFWFERPQAATAAKKAFIVTRIGDTGLLIGLFLIFFKLGTLNIGEVLKAASGGDITAGLATAMALLLFAGAIGKSAQIPLYVWLPDAMEGPTPVSALIHAATMVTAGVYLVVRMGPLFELSHAAQTIVAVVGAVTALYAASLALAEEDIKRVLAYSTISQLGYMFVAAGVGAYAAAMFHLTTHAFFKALLFLAAGSVMHGLGGETALDRMGGLRRALPWTFLVTTIGWAAISGFLPLAGFFSKDAIVAEVWGGGQTGVFVLLALASVLTPFYMSRLWFLTFSGEPRWSEGTHPHESPPSMIVPMVALALLSIVGGILNLPGHLSISGILPRFLSPVVGRPHEAESIGVAVFMWAISVFSVFVAWVIYGARIVDRHALRERLGPVNTLLRNKFFVDEIYATLIVSPARLIAAFFAYVVDLRIIDGAVNGTATVVDRAAGSWRKVQSGFVRNYAVAVFAGAAGMVVYFAVRRA
jgi:NADH-quinone oxidoreductase subunit L